MDLNKYRNTVNELEADLAEAVQDERQSAIALTEARLNYDAATRRREGIKATIDIIKSILPKMDAPVDPPGPPVTPEPPEVPVPPAQEVAVTVRSK